MRRDRFWSHRGPSRWLGVLVVASLLAGLTVLLKRGPMSATSPGGAGDAQVIPQGPSRLVAVAPAGSDRGPGTPAYPWRTLRRGLLALRPGDTLVIGAGTYDERLTDLSVRPGRADAPVRVRAAAGTRPRLRGLLWLENPDYWDVRGLDVTWSDRNSSDEHMVKFTGGTGWSFRSAELSQARSFAALLVTGRATRFLLSDLYVHDTFPTNGRNQDHLVYINTDGGDGILERSLLVNSSNGRGVKVGPERPRRRPVGGLTIRYNTLYNNTGPSNVQLSYKTQRVRIYRNILVRPGTGSASVTTFHLQGVGNQVYDNLVFEAEGALSPGLPGLKDLGGNIVADPGFLDAASGDFHTSNPRARSYGRYAEAEG